MSVTSIGGSGILPTQSTSVAQSAAQNRQGDWQNMLSSVSSTLGLTSTALQQQLQSGQSLSQVAQAQGVSQGTLVQSITSALQQNGSTASSTQLQQIAASIADRTHSAGGHHHHHGGGGVNWGEQQSTSTSPSSASSLSSLLTALTSSTASSSSDDSQSDSGLDTFA